MMAMDETKFAALAPLLPLLNAAEPMRLVVRPGSVLVDRPQGSAAAVVAWDAAQHAAALDVIGAAPLRLPSGATVAVLGDIIIVRAPARADRRTDDLVREGYVSALAARTLSAALALGRNVLVTGPWLGSVQLIAALAADGRRPAVIGMPGDAVPPCWPLFFETEAASTYGADRIVSWSLSAGALTNVMRRHNGVVGWLEARRLDRALMRFEAALEGTSPAPLQVLAALDLVVVVNDVPSVRVTDVAEITLVDEGYRPQLLFTSGVAPLPLALVPVAMPSFVAELAQAGFAVLADELRHGVPASRVAAAEPEPAVPEQRTTASTPSSRSSSLNLVARERAPYSSQLVATHDSTAFDSRELDPPGWELDRLGEAATPTGAVDGGANLSSEDANIAAALGLSPPPRPVGMRVERRAFDEALRRAKERDEDSSEDESS